MASDIKPSDLTGLSGILPRVKGFFQLLWEILIKLVSVPFELFYNLPLYVKLIIAIIILIITGLLIRFLYKNRLIIWVRLSSDR